MADFPLLSFVHLLAGGVAAGLFLQSLAVLTGVGSQSRRDYALAALIGLVGSLIGIPVAALLDYARGGPGELSRLIGLSAGLPTALLFVFYWIAFRQFNRAGRLGFIATAIIAVALFLFIVTANAVRH